jgi:phosphoglucomutase
MDNIYLKHGLHHEYQLNLRMEGSDGMLRMQRLMAALRERPPATLGAMDVAARRDFLNRRRIVAGGAISAFSGPSDNLIILELQREGNFVAVRPSGTEPKVKFYMFTYLPPGDIESLAAAKTLLATRISAIEHDLRKFANGI